MDRKAYIEMTEDCVFCEIEKGVGTEDSYNAHIMDTSHFYVVADWGQICEEYVIICIKKKHSLAGRAASPL